MKKQIDVELAQLGGLMERHPQLLAKKAQDVLTPVEIDAVAALPHSFYTGVEDLLKRISVTIDAARRPERFGTCDYWTV